VALPPAVHDDSVEAAEHLMRVPGSELIVDGYNVALTSWSDGGGPGAAATDLPSLRLRLIDSLNELALRYQRRAVVVFDGIDAGTRRSVSGPARPLVRVVFSPSSVEADEVIVETVRHLAPGVPAIVATDDRAVRAAVSGLGANVVSVGQLLAVLRRQPSA
jgi:predicted RNA-binding protein with PIN domain